VVPDGHLTFKRTRLAPSPTGSLHLGHARTFLITWWLARTVGAEVILRMEDLDARRAKPESVQLTYDDLRWLGLDWDAGPAEASGERPGATSPTGNERYGRAQAGAARGDGDRLADEYVQSRRRALYEEALDYLWRDGVIYPCTCSRAEIAAAVGQSAGAPQEGDVQVRYPGTCRPIRRHAAASRQAAAAHLRQTSRKPVCWRFHVPEVVVEFEDAVYGRQAWRVHEDSGDFPVTRFDDTPAYQLAVVVDDAAMGVDCVIRGDDLLSSTPRQILLYRALGRDLPKFAHVPLVVGLDGRRLAKRHGESRIAQFREAGVPASKIVGWVAWQSGQLDRPREMEARELVGRFDLSRLSRQRVVLTAADLAWLR